jgi:tetratricopeptide (TPR) repeat protein
VADQLARLTAVLADRYRVERELGHGGMANVYLAEDLKHRRSVAIKVLKPDLQAALGSARFLREIQITARLTHPHILPMLDSGEAGGLLYYVMPYAAGESLQDLLRRKKQLPIDHAVQITREVADALACAHGQGVVHRDIKPANILLEGEHAVVSDFGIAHAITEAGGEVLTSSGIAVGTPGYMSPEQASGETELDGRSDVYSLGCVLYEMVVGETPFTGPTYQAIVSRQMLEAPPSMRVVRESVSPALEAVTLKALAKAPADRFQTVDEFRRALDEALVHPERGMPRPRWKQLAIGAGVLGAALAGGLAGPKVVETLRPRALSASRVLVYPIAARSGLDAHRVAGEDVATIIGHSLDAAGPIQWIEGWQLLGPEERADVSRLAHDEALRIARRQGCGHFVRGVMAVSGDSALVTLELRSTAGDTLVRSASAGGLLVEAWRIGIRALNGLLPALIPGDTRDLGEEWRDRDPNAVASFLAGEASFRRARFEEALEHFERAVELDSAFALAAVRGAQAATWHHGATDAGRLIDLALSHAPGLAPKHRLFAEGLDGFIEGRADDAVRALRAAIDTAPDFALAHGLLGEVYTHLIPSDPYPDSLAEAAFLEARRLDPAAVPPLFHLSEIALRKGDRAWATRLVDSLVAAEPDSAVVGSILLMRDCVLHGEQAVDGRLMAQTIPQEVIEAGKSLAVGGYQKACAKVMFRAILDSDTARGGYGEGRRWAALVGLHNMLMIEGHADRVPPMLDSAILHGMPAAARLYVLDAAAGYGFERQADSIALAHEQRYGPNFEQQRASVWLWLLGAWDARRGCWQRTEALAANLAGRGNAADSLLARALLAHAALAKGDTAEALRRFEELKPNAPPRAGMAWGLAESLVLERAREVRLLEARSERRAVAMVGSGFDSPASLMLTLGSTRAALRVQ